MLGEGAVELAGNAGAAIDQDGGAVGPARLEQRGRQIDTVACGKNEVHCAMWRVARLRDKRIARGQG